MRDHVIIRQLKLADWDGVRVIYLQGIGTGNATFEIEAPTWEAWAAGHLEFARCPVVAWRTVWVGGTEPRLKVRGVCRRSRG